MSEHNETEELKQRLDFVREQLFGKKRFADLTEHEFKQLKFVTGAIGGAKESNKLSKSVRAFIREVGSDQNSVLGQAVEEILKGISNMSKLYEAIERSTRFDRAIVDQLIEHVSDGALRVVIGGAIRGIKEPNDTLQMRKIDSAHYIFEDGVDTIFLGADIPEPSTMDDKQTGLFNILVEDLLALYDSNKLFKKAFRPIKSAGGAQFDSAALLDAPIPRS